MLDGKSRAIKKPGFEGRASLTILVVCLEGYASMTRVSTVELDQGSLLQKVFRSRDCGVL